MSEAGFSPHSRIIAHVTFPKSIAVSTRLITKKQFFTPTNEETKSKQLKKHLKKGRGTYVISLQAVTLVTTDV
jgi:hypothetical protein